MVERQCGRTALPFGPAAPRREVGPPAVPSLPYLSAGCSPCLGPPRTFLGCAACDTHIDVRGGCSLRRISEKLWSFCVVWVLAGQDGCAPVGRGVSLVRWRAAVSCPQVVGLSPHLSADFWGSAPDPTNLIKDLSSAVCGLMARLLRRWVAVCGWYRPTSVVCQRLLGLAIAGLTCGVASPVCVACG